MRQTSPVNHAVNRPSIPRKGRMRHIDMVHLLRMKPHHCSLPELEDTAAPSYVVPKMSHRIRASHQPELLPLCKGVFSNILMLNAYCRPWSDSSIRSGLYRGPGADIKKCGTGGTNHCLLLWLLLPKHLPRTYAIGSLFFGVPASRYRSRANS